MDRITVNSQIHFGKPCIAGTRITVQGILELLNEGLAFNEIIRDYYPDLQIEDIRIVQIYSEIELSRGFVVVEPDGHRFRQLTSQELG